MVSGNLRPVEHTINSFMIAAREDPAANVVQVAGELDISARPEMDAALAAAAVSGRAVIVDLGELSFIDSSGIHALVLAQRQAAAAGRRLLVVKGTEPVMRVLALCGLESRVSVHESLERALAAARSAMTGPVADGHDAVPFAA